MRKLKVLVACEESQRVCTAFRELGHEAYSCDIIEPSGEHPEWHIQDDALAVIDKSLHGRPIFTMNHDLIHLSGKWDIIIAHPPCTYLSAAGAVRLYDSNHQVKDYERYKKGVLAAEFFRAFLNADFEHIAVENPVPLKCYALPKYTQIIQPYFFGDPWKKKTCLWLKGLPPLQPDDVVQPKGYWIGAYGHDKAPYGMIKGFRSQKTRSKTFEGIARAMAEQWSTYILSGKEQSQ